jgi:hypothetical protein
MDSGFGKHEVRCFVRHVTAMEHSGGGRQVGFNTENIYSFLGTIMAETFQVRRSKMLFWNKHKFQTLPQGLDP